MQQINILLKTVASILLVLVASRNSNTPQNKSDIISGKGVFARNGMVATDHLLAFEIGARNLKEGRNDFNAAVAVKFAMAVVYPCAGNRRVDDTAFGVK